MYHANPHDTVLPLQSQQIIHHPLAIEVAPPTPEIAPRLYRLHHLLRALAIDGKTHHRHPQPLIRRLLAINRNARLLAQVGEQDRGQLLLVGFDRRPGLLRVGGEVGYDIWEGGDEFVAGGCEVEFGGEVVAGVEVVA